MIGILLFTTAFLRETFLLNDKKSNSSSSSLNSIIGAPVYYVFAFLVGLFSLTIVLIFLEHLFFYIKNLL